MRVSRENPHYTELSDGTPFIAIGYNLARPRYCNTLSEDECFNMIETHMKEISQNGGNYVRLWASHAFYEIEDARAGVYNPKKIARIDRFMSLARKYGIRVKICLEHFRNVKNYVPAENERGLNSGVFLRPAYDGEFENMTEYFESEKGRELYFKRFKVFADKYRDDPTVFAWELWNEQNTVSANPEAVKRWQEYMFARIAKECPNHLVVNSYGSLDSPRSERSYNRFYKDSANPIACVHRYLDEGAAYPVCQAPIDVLAADAVDAIKKIAPNRPAYLAETGGVQPRHSGPIRFYEKDADGVIFHDTFYTPFFRGAAGSGMIWHWDHYVYKNKLWWHIKPFSRLVEGVNPIAENFKPVRLDAGGCRIYALIGKTCALAFARDAASDWKSEFLEGRKPSELAGVSVDFSKYFSAEKIAKVRAYNLWGDGVAELEKSPKAVLPPFTRSTAVRIDLK